MTRVGDELPEGIDGLRALADGEGIENVGTLVDSWTSGRERFADPGALFAVWMGGELGGVGGLTVQAGLGIPAMRMRRLYVAPEFRRMGLGRNLAAAMIQQGLEVADVLTCNARASDMAATFWETMEFERAPPGHDFTHWLKRGG